MFDIEFKPDLKISKLRPFKNHPFAPLDEVSMNEMAKSIKNVGVVTPISVRLIDEKKEIYEILSGHKRTQGAKAAGLKTISARIFKNLSDDEAMLIVCDTNFFQVSFPTFSHSEKARSISQYYNALKSQGKRNDLTKNIDDLLDTHKNQDNNKKETTSAELVQKSTARDKAVQKFGMDRGTITNYLRVSKLSSELLNRLDNGEFKIAPAVEISYLKEDEQGYLNTILENRAYKLDTNVAAELRTASKKSPLSQADIEAIFERNKKDTAKKYVSFKLPKHIWDKYFKPDQKPEEVEAHIIKALSEYQLRHFKLK